MVDFGLAKKHFDDQGRILPGATRPLFPFRRCTGADSRAHALASPPQRARKPPFSGPPCTPPSRRTSTRCVRRSPARQAPHHRVGGRSPTSPLTPGQDLGRKDDLWSIWFMLVDLVRPDLPWRSERKLDRHEVYRLKTVCGAGAGGMAALPVSDAVTTRRRLRCWTWTSCCAGCGATSS